MEILLFKKTTDADLKIGLQVCYKDTYGEYSKIGIITGIFDYYWHYLYSIDTSSGIRTADELKLIKQP